MPRYHALLIGIDDYGGPDLGGCAQDVDAVAALLRDHAGVPPESIAVLVSPRPGAAAGDLLAAGAQPATRGNILQALDRLSQVGADDRVLIYYSGHGAGYEGVGRSAAARAYFEALVPADYRTAGLLYDHQLNPRLSAIARRCGDLTVVLDCCYSQGAVRSIESRSVLRDRYLPPSYLTPELAPPEEAAQAPAARLCDLSGADEERSFTVIAACHADERAREASVLDLGGAAGGAAAGAIEPAGAGAAERRHGVFTRSLLELLSPLPRGELWRVCWADIWERLKQRVMQRNPDQHPVILGPRERPILGGAYQARDVGLALRRDGEQYVLQGGTLAGVGPGAEVALYPRAVLRFLPVGTEAEVQQRVGLLRVDAADEVQARAHLIDEVRGAAGPAWDPAEVQGRLVQPGAGERLRVALLETVPVDLRERLQDLPGLEWVSPEAGGVGARVGVDLGGQVWVGDDLHGGAAELPAPLGYAGHIDRDARWVLLGRLEAGLRHYAGYARPLRMAERARQGAGGLPADALRLSVIDCSDLDLAGRRALVGDARRREEARRSERCWSQVREGGLVCFHVHNAAASPLYVTLLWCGDGGDVRVLQSGDTSGEMIAGRSGQLFWHLGEHGDPYVCRRAPGRGWGVTRIVAVGVDRRDTDLRSLHAPAQLQAVMDAVGEEVATRGRHGVEPVLWTAAVAYLQVGSRDG